MTIRFAGIFARLNERSSLAFNNRPKLSHDIILYAVYTMTAIMTFLISFYLFYAAHLQKIKSDKASLVIIGITLILVSLISLVRIFLELYKDIKISDKKTFQETPRALEKSAKIISTAFFKVHQFQTFASRHAEKLLEHFDLKLPSARFEGSSRMQRSELNFRFSLPKFTLMCSGFIFTTGLILLGTDMTPKSKSAVLGIAIALILVGLASMLGSGLELIKERQAIVRQAKLELNRVEIPNDQYRNYQTES